MGRVHNDTPGVITVEGSGGQTRWSSDFPPVNLLPESAWLTGSLTVVFPDFSKFINYGYKRYSEQPDLEDGEWTPSGSGDTCVSITMIEPENQALTSALNIGTIPAGANYIDVRVKLDRTKAPYPFRDQTPPSLIPNEWISLPGGSCLVEATQVWRRSFDVVLDGQDLQLIRRQSVGGESIADVYDQFGRRNGIYRNINNGPSDPWGSTDASGWGWINGGDFNQNGNPRFGHPAALIQSKPFSGNSGHDAPTMGAKHPVRSNACSMNNSAHDFSSTYTGQIVIRPGYIRS